MFNFVKNIIEKARTRRDAKRFFSANVTPMPYSGHTPNPTTPGFAKVAYKSETLGFAPYGF